MNQHNILILGVTASGKGRLAFALADTIAAEIISVDSMKVYRRMDIGTAKPPLSARQYIRHHLIDVVEPSESFSVAHFLKLAADSVNLIKQLNKPVIAVGGTALYIKAMLYGLFDGPGCCETIRNNLKHRAEVEGLGHLHKELAQVDPDSADRIHPNDLKRIVRALEIYELTGRPISSFQTQFSAESTKHNWTVIGLRRNKNEENGRINSRVKKMIADGLIDEVRTLLAEEKPLGKQARCAIGYSEIIDYLAGKTTLDDTVELMKKNTRRMAKSQRTWFKTFQNVNWLDVESDNSTDRILTRIKKLLNRG